MVKLSVGCVASFFDDESLAQPQAALLDILEKKSQYLAKRIEKLRGYNEEALYGKQLPEVKEEARKKLPEVELQAEYITFLIKTTKEQARMYKKMVRQRDEVVRKALSARVQETVEEQAMFKEIVRNITEEITWVKFADYAQREGSDEDKTIVDQKELLEELRALWDCSICHCSSNEEWKIKLYSSSTVMASILRQDSTQVFEEMTGAELHKLLTTIKDSKFWDTFFDLPDIKIEEVSVIEKVEDVPVTMEEHVEEANCVVNELPTPIEEKEINYILQDANLIENGIAGIRFGYSEGSSPQLDTPANTEKENGSPAPPSDPEQSQDESADKESSVESTATVPQQKKAPRKSHKQNVPSEDRVAQHAHRRPDGSTNKPRTYNNRNTYKPRTNANKYYGSGERDREYRPVVSRPPPGQSGFVFVRNV